MEGNSSPSTHNTLMYSAVEGVEGKTEEILFDEVFVVLCIIRLSFGCSANVYYPQGKKKILCVHPSCLCHLRAIDAKGQHAI